MKRQNYFFILIGALVFTGCIGVTVLAFLNRPVNHVTQVKPAYQLSSRELFEEYVSDESAANEKYLGKVIGVTGTIQDISPEKAGASMSIMLNGGQEMSGVNCEVETQGNPAASNLHPGDQVIVKGICTGILLDVVLTNCSIEKAASNEVIS